MACLPHDKEHHDSPQPGTDPGATEPAPPIVSSGGEPSLSDDSPQPGTDPGATEPAPPIVSSGGEPSLSDDSPQPGTDPGATKPAPPIVSSGGEPSLSDSSHAAFPPSHSALDPSGPPFLGQASASSSTYHAHISFEVAATETMISEEVSYMGLEGSSSLVGCVNQSGDLKSVENDICTLKKKLESTVKELECTIKLKDEAERKLDDAQAEIARKDAEIEQLTNQVEDYKQRSSDERTRYEAKIRSLQEELKSKEEAHKVEEAELKVTIAECGQKIAEMKAVEVELRCELVKREEKLRRERVEAEFLRYREECAGMRRSLTSLADDESRVSLTDLNEQFEQLDSLGSGDGQQQQPHSM